MKLFPKKKLNPAKLPENILAVAFFLFIILTGYFSLKNYWDVRTSGVTETADGFSVENDFESNFNILLWQEDKYVEYYGLAAKLLGQPKLNEVVKLKNGYLSGVEELVPEENLKNNADNLLKLQQYLEGRGSTLLYVQTPYKINKFDNELPAGIEDYSNQNIDTFMNYLTENGVNTIDIRQTMYEDGMNQYDYFFRTDHHWTPEAGFYAYGKIVDYVEKKLGIDVDEQVKSLENYQIDNYKDWHLGTNGQRTGIYYGGIDDFQLISPLFDTQLINMDTQVSGSYHEILIEDAVLKEESRAVYDIAYGNSIGHYFHNPNAANDARVIVVSDSMGKVVAPFLILAYQDVYTTGYDLTTQKIEEFNPDIVIYVTYPANIGGDSFNVVQ